MKALLHSAILLLLCLQAAFCLECYECEHNEKENREDDDCKKNGEDISSELLTTCASGEDVCIFTYTIDEDDKETYIRGCADSSEGYNEESDKCYGYEKFGVQYEECICDSDECNGASAVSPAAVAAVASSAASLMLVRRILQ